MSYTQCIYHIIFRTYRSEKSIPESMERTLYGYILSYCRNHDIKLIRIGGMPDHLHMLVSLPPALAVAGFVNGVKTATSKWLRGSSDFPAFHGWASGYAAFSYGVEMVPVIKQYIMNQKVHHKSHTLEEEARQQLGDNGIALDERYFFKD